MRAKFVNCNFIFNLFRVTSAPWMDRQTDERRLKERTIKMENLLESPRNPKMKLLTNEGGKINRIACMHRQSHNVWMPVDPNGGGCSVTKWMDEVGL